MPKILLQTDDMEIGMFITVYKGEIKEVSNPDPSSDVGIIGVENRVFNGEVLKILCIDLPYIVVEYVPYPNSTSLHKRTIDIRRVKLMRISDDYVRCYRHHSLKEGEIKEWRNNRHKEWRNK